MGKYEKLYSHILMRLSDSNVSFSQLCQLMRMLGFKERIKGYHHIYTMAGVEEILNLQPKGSKAKPYQVGQVRRVILKYNLKVEG